MSSVFLLEYLSTVQYSGDAFLILKGWRSIRSSEVFMITMPAMDSIDMRIGCTDEDLVCKGCASLLE